MTRPISSQALWPLRILIFLLGLTPVEGSDARRVALLVGISEYSDSALNLDSPRADVEAFTRFLAEKTEGAWETHRLLDSEATGDRIQRGLEEALTGLGPEDTFLFFYSGHGFRKGSGSYLFPHDGVRGPELERRALGMASLIAHITGSGAGHRVILLDCCYSGGAARGGLIGERPGVAVDDSLSSRLAQGGVSLLASSEPGELSWEDIGRPDSTGLSFFTRFVLRGLEGEADGFWGEGQGNLDGWVSLVELYKFVKAKVSRAVLERWKKRQTTSLHFHGDDVDLVRVPGRGRLIPQGSLNVRSRPQGARVRIDGVDTDKVTDAFVDLDPGSHTVEVVLEGYAPARRKIEIGPDAFEEVDFELEAHTVSLGVNSRPPGARIVLDGSPLPLKTPQELTGLNTGHHVLRLEKPGHHPHEEQIRVRPGSNPPVQVDLQPLVTTIPSPDPPQLRVESDPSQAMVVLDGRQVGLTPWVGDTTPGAHTLHLRLRDRADRILRIYLEAGKNRTVRETLLPRTGARSVRVVSIPVGASLDVDEVRQADRTPLSLELAPGHHALLFRLGGYEDLEKDVLIEADGPSEIHARLEARLARLRIITRPPGATVTANGRPASHRTPVVLQLHGGTHLLEITKPDQTTVERQVRLVPGGSATLVFDLD